MATTMAMQRRRTPQRTSLLLVVLLGVLVTESKSIFEMGLPEDEFFWGRHLLQGAASMARSMSIHQMNPEPDPGPASK